MQEPVEGGAGHDGADAAGLRRGYTDHEQLDDLGLVHMNGRVYDPVLGRFLSADPFVGSAYDSQDYNRYSYVGNNPMNATDPSGYFSLKDALKIVAIIVVGVVTAGAALAAIVPGMSLWGGICAVATASFGAGWAGFANAVIAGAAGGFGSGFAGSLLNGGSIGDAFKAGLIGAVVGGVTAGLTFGIGTISGDLGYFGTAVAHGVAQGGVSEATGGSFRHGFYSGFAASAAGGKIDGIGKGKSWGASARVAAAAVVGGTASRIGGGKFANGAVSGAFVRLFNEEAHAAAHATAVKSRYALTIMSNVASSEGVDFTAGHSALAVYDSITGETHTYGLWPDAHPDIHAAGLSDVSASDIRKDFYRDDPSLYKYQHTVNISDAQYASLMDTVSSNQTWGYINNCSAFSSSTFLRVTGVNVSARDGVFFSTPRAVGENITKLNIKVGTPTPVKATSANSSL